MKSYLLREIPAFGYTFYSRLWKKNTNKTTPKDPNFFPLSPNSPSPTKKYSKGERFPCQLVSAAWEKNNDNKKIKP